MLAAAVLEFVLCWLAFVEFLIGDAFTVSSASRSSDSVISVPQRSDRRLSAYHANQQASFIVTVRTSVRDKVLLCIHDHEIIHFIRYPAGLGGGLICNEVSCS